MQAIPLVAFSLKCLKSMNVVAHPAFCSSSSYRSTCPFVTGWFMAITDFKLLSSGQFGKKTEVLSQHFISAVLCRCISEKSFWPRECVSELLKTKCVPARLVLKDLKPVLLVPRQSKSGYCGLCVVYTAISRKVVGKSARDNPERYCG